MNADRKNTREQDRNMVYELDGRPSLSTAVPLGRQHVLAMFTSNLAPILIIAGVCGLSGADTVTMVQCAMFVSGLTTFIQLYPLRLGSRYQVGARLPIVMGTSFTFVPTASAVGAAGGIGAMTRVVNRWCIATGAFILMISGFFPKLGVLFSAIPNAVLGGAIITVFGMILINGIKMIAKAGFSERNILVMGLTFVFGIGVPAHPDAVAQLPGFIRFIFNDAVTATCIMAILANLLFPLRDQADIELAKEAMRG
ncbi:solute carrier family 23 protein [uncultured Oscillibacter sp.]|uniref:solute carrier family 23 protein n=1 Tax=uncultured Oscillibacter sp. TaxID=876091 RepID=UPI0025FDBDC3|nr:solute carrier family 23 protein [uncultured Oscillibacter sp.]